MSGHARAAWRLLALAAVTAASAAAWQGQRLATRGDPALREARRARMVHRWCRAVVRLLRISVDVTGSPPGAPFLLVSNHLSYVDVVVLGSIVEASFVAKAEVARWPLVGPMARLAGTLFVDRRSGASLARAVERARGRLAAGAGLVVFPEGTTTAGDRVLPFRSALLQPAVEAGVPVWHAAIRYETPPGAPPPDEVLCWWRDMTFVPHLYGLLRLQSFRATVRLGHTPPLGRDRKALARALHAEVRERVGAQEALEAR